jgi:hypothetical protein
MAEGGFMLFAVVTLTVLSADPGEIAENVCTQLHQAATGQMNAADAKRFGGTLQYRLDDFRERMINAFGTRVAKLFTKSDAQMLTKVLRSDAEDFVEYCSRLVVDLTAPCVPDTDEFPQCVKRLTPALSCVQHTMPWAYLFRLRHSFKGEHEDIPGTLDFLLAGVKSMKPCRQEVSAKYLKALPQTDFDKGGK